MIKSVFLDEELAKLAKLAKLVKGKKQVPTGAEFALTHAAKLISAYRRADEEVVKGAGKYTMVLKGAGKNAVDITFSWRGPKADVDPKQPEPERRGDSLRFLRTLWTLEDPRPDKKA